MRTVAVAGLASMLLVPAPSAFADKDARGERRAEKRVIRQHPGGLIQAEWLHRQAIRDEQGRDLGKVREVGEAGPRRPRRGW